MVVFIRPFLRHFFITHGLFLPHAFSTLLSTTTSQHVVLKHGFEKGIGNATLTNTIFGHELILPHHATRQTPPITPPEHTRHAQLGATTQRHQHITRACQGATHQANRAAHGTRPTHPANTNNQTTQHTSPPKHQPINRRHCAPSLAQQQATTETQRATTDPAKSKKSQGKHRQETNQDTQRRTQKWKKTRTHTTTTKKHKPHIATTNLKLMMAPSLKQSKPKTRQTVAKPLRLKGAKPQAKERQTRSGAGSYRKVGNKW